MRLTSLELRSALQPRPKQFLRQVLTELSVYLQIPVSGILKLYAEKLMHVLAQVQVPALLQQVQV